MSINHIWETEDACSDYMYDSVSPAIEICKFTREQDGVYSVVVDIDLSKEEMIESLKLLGLIYSEDFENFMTDDDELLDNMYF